MRLHDIVLCSEHYVSIRSVKFVCTAHTCTVHMVVFALVT